MFVSEDYVSGGEMFTHLYQRDHFSEDEVRIYVGEIILALEHLHKVLTSTGVSAAHAFIDKHLHTYTYSGYGKYSDPLKFFTLCYIAAIC